MNEDQETTSYILMAGFLSLFVCLIGILLELEEIVKLLKQNLPIVE